MEQGSSARRKRARQRLESVVDTARINLKSQIENVNHRLNCLRLWTDTIQTQYDRVCLFVDPDPEPEPEPEPELEPEPEGEADSSPAESGVEDIVAAAVQRPEIDVLSDEQNLKQAARGIHTLTSIERMLLGILAELAQAGSVAIDAQLETGAVNFTEPINYPELMRKQKVAATDAAALHDTAGRNTPDLEPDEEAAGGAEDTERQTEREGEAAHPTGPASFSTATSGSAASLLSSSSDEEFGSTSKSQRKRRNSGAARLLLQRKAQSVVLLTRMERSQRSQGVSRE